MKLLIDSDFLVGLFRANDAHHPRVVELFEKVKNERAELFVTNLVIQESATVLSHRDGAEAVKMFFQVVNKLQLFQIRVTKKDEDMAWEIMLSQTKKGCSFVDFANLAVIKEHNLDKLLAFDKFYSKDLRF